MSRYAIIFALIGLALAGSIACGDDDYSEPDAAGESCPVIPIVCPVTPEQLGECWAEVITCEQERDAWKDIATELLDKLRNCKHDHGNHSGH